MRYSDLNETTSTQYYHGSFNELSIGTMLATTEGGHTNNAPDELEQVFEKHKPSDRISRKAAVYLTTDPEDIDALGGYTDYIYQVEPLGKLEKKRSCLVHACTGIARESSQ
jgi:hypothetical protein